MLQSHQIHKISQSDKNDNQCFLKCCESEKQTFSVDQLNYCLSNENQKSIVAIVVFSIFGAIFIISFIFCFRMGPSNCLGAIKNFFICIGGTIAYVFCCQCCKDKHDQQQVHSAVQLQSNRTMIWQDELNPQSKLNDQQQNCAICLNSQTNVVTLCGHCYHLQCIEAWFKKNHQCPLCKSERINEIKFFCRGCCIKYLRFDLKYGEKIQEKIKEMKGPNCPICQ